MDLKIDEARKDIGGTGIFVKAKDSSGKWMTCDIAELDAQSLLAFLRSRGGDNRWAEDCVGIILGHGHLHKQYKKSEK